MREGPVPDVAACKLGCASKYEVSITYRGGTQPLGVFEPEVVTWTRVRDDWSEARVDLPASCCGKLEQVRSWSHELHIARDGEEVWCGPVLVDTSCRSGNVIIARDMLWWLNRRVIHEDHISAAQGAVSIARDLIVDGFAPDDPNVLAYLDTAGVGVISDREYLANSKYVLDALKDLAKGAIDVTAIGRRIVVRPQGTELGRTAMLNCEDFQGDVCGSDNGLQAATKAIITDGKDVPIVGSFGGVDPYFGLVEVLETDSTITSASTATDQARAIVAAGNPPPLLVQPPDTSALSPDAPVCMSQLVPGVVIPVVLDCVCRSVAQDMRLTKLTVRWDASGEQVGPLLQPVSTEVSE
jgi:hypothetical protein